MVNKRGYFSALRDIGLELKLAVKLLHGPEAIPSVGILI